MNDSQNETAGFAQAPDDLDNPSLQVQQSVAPAASGVQVDTGQPVQPSAPAPTHPAPAVKCAADDLPVIRDWKPAPGFSVLGVLVGAAVWILLAFLVGPLVAWIIQAIVVAVYALVFYRSYFTEHPRITSSKVISFLNYAVSFSSNIVSVVIGWCWNQNLKKSHETGTPKMGISYIVAIVYFCLMIGLMFWYENTPHLVHNPDGSYTYVNQPAAQSASSSPAAQSTRPSGSQQVTVPSTNARITVPATWDYKVYEQGGGSSGKTLVLFPSYASGDTAALVITWDASEYMTEEFIAQYGDDLSIQTVSEDVVLEHNRMNMDAVESEAAELVEIGGVDYWKAQTKGTYSGSPMTDTSYYCFAGERMYQYTLSSLGESEQTNKALADDFAAMIASISYE